MENAISIFETGDYGKIQKLLYDKESKVCEDCSLGMYVWKDRYKLELIKIAGGYVFHSKADDSFMFPMPLEKAVDVIKELFKERTKLEFHRVTKEQRELLEDNFPGCFDFVEDEGSYDYLYEVEALAELRGKKLSKKRNHINSFLKTYDNWRTEVITKENVQDCIEFAKDWYIAKDDKAEAGSDSLNYEKESLFKVLENFEYLNAEGILLRIEGKCLAFTVGQRISSYAYDVVFEKADEQIRGAYNIINREFVRYLRRKYPDLKYINRENDLNLPGLRKAKNSYMPCEIVTKYDAKA